MQGDREMKRTLPAMEGIRFDGKNRVCKERYVTFRKT